MSTVFDRPLGRADTSDGDENSRAQFRRPAQSMPFRVLQGHISSLLRQEPGPSPGTLGKEEVAPRGCAVCVAEGKDRPWEKTKAESQRYRPSSTR